MQIIQFVFPEEERIFSLGLPFILSSSHSKMLIFDELIADYYKIWCVCPNASIL